MAFAAQMRSATSVHRPMGCLPPLRAKFPV